MEDNNEVELLDIDEVSIDDKEENEGKKVKQVKKRRLKKGLWQTVFCLISLIFIIGCIIFYGSRLIKYYKIYNPKIEGGSTGVLISNAIFQKAEYATGDDGIYFENGLYVYKGSEVDNYVKYSNLTWRIVRTNVDGSLELILDDYINILAWDFKENEYIKSDIHEYLNDVFVSQLDTSYLVKTSICTDAMASVDKFTCNNKNNDYYVKLIPANDFLNSINDDKTYIADSDDLVWLGTYNKENRAWLANGSSISSAEVNNTYYVKPVITLKNSTQLLGGTGSIDDPYTVEKSSKTLKLGSYIKLGEDTWIVYEKNDDSVKLVYSSNADGGNTYRFDTEKVDYDATRDNSLAKLLNERFYDTLSYKDLLLEFEVYTGTYKDSYKNMYKEKTKVKVGIPSAIDLKFNNEEDGYYLSTKSPRENKIYYYKGDLISSKPGMSRVFRPTISIKIPKISKGNGSSEKPFEIEV